LGVSLLDIYGNPYLGVLCRANEDTALVPFNIDGKELGVIEGALGVKARRMRIGGAIVLGSLSVMNSKGALLPHFCAEEDIQALKGPLTIGVLPSKHTACGNNILANDKAALISPEYDEKSRVMIADVLGVEVQEGTIAGLETVGSVAYVTNKGMLVHPKTTQEEMDSLSALFKVPIKKTTANYGTPFIGACLIANSKGAVIGSLSTGIEIGNIEDSLYL
jgi:translation initiation factor 6